MTDFIDLHSHIAWGIDDGMPSKEGALKALKNASEDGIVGICSTPHFVNGQLDENQIRSMFFRQVELAKLASQFNIEIYSGAEMFMDESFVDALKKGWYQTINNTRYLLCEFDVRQDIHDIASRNESLYEIEVRHMVPLIAHVERYFHKGLDYEILDRWKENGYVFQINRTSLLGLHGKTIKKNAWELIENGYAALICTDTHRADGHRIEILSDVHEELIQRVGEEKAKMLLYTNPLKILLNKKVVPVEKTEKKGFFRR